ncbi:MAG: L,D-transpeptidase family protein [Pasteurellaceae bacterium]|nr:L,D-transpeptidase family protein [Pasteurellaceae bacterium]
MKNKFNLKLARLGVLVSALCTGCAIAEHNKDNIEVDLATQQQTEEQRQADAERQTALNKAEEDRLAFEKQQQDEAKLADIIGNRDLQFKGNVAKIYADNGYTPIWTNSAAEKQFLHDYAMMLASGISSRSMKSLEAIDQLPVNDANALVRDMLITDAFLDYMYYAKNVSRYAQSWFYNNANYKVGNISEETINQWLTAVKNQQDNEFIKNLSSNNRLYRQTVDYISNNIGKSKAESLYKLALNAQRLRMLPDFTNGIFVNIPSYQLNYYRDGQVILNSRVIVGKNERRTPVMSSKLSNVVVNPPWNAPERLINEDIIPKVKRDPGYLARNGYSIIDGKGNVIDPYNINWSAVGAKFPYRLRQAAGDNSALGRYKFNMPSSDAIYLHDTPNHALFNKAARSLSSGCVRVDKSDQLASILLKESGWSDQRKQSVLESKKTTSAAIQSNNPVYLYYVTFWIDNGKIQNLADIYSYDKSAPSYLNWAILKKYIG